MSDPQAVELLRVIADAVTRGSEGAKHNGDLRAALADDQGSVLDAVRAVEARLASIVETGEGGESETPVETAPVTGANAIRSACAAIRSEQAAHAAYIESRLSIIESNL